MDFTLLKQLPSSFLLRLTTPFRHMNNTLSKAFAVSIQSFMAHLSISLINKLTTTPLKEATKKDLFTLGEINTVIRQLGLPQCCGDQSTEGIDIFSVFDDEEPSLSEVKVAFDVFDENSDGFIDEFELQRMLHKIGQMEKANLEECRSMIRGFDVNGDGVIDFEEFVKLMETCCF